MLRISRDEAAASQLLQQRVEQLRMSNWQRLSGATGLSEDLLSTSADGSEALASLSERVTVFESGGTHTNLFTRINGRASAGAANTSLVNAETIRVEWAVSWVGAPHQRLRTRQTALFIGKGGLIQ